MTYLKQTRIIRPLSQFGELEVTQKSAIIELKSAVDYVSVLRNVSSVTGGGTVDVNGSEYELATTAAASDDAELLSAERGRYLPGFSAQAGIGIRLGSGVTFAGTSNCEWGYFNGTDGYGFGIDATGIYVFVLRGGSKNKTYQGNWNNDKLDGSAGTAFTLNLEAGNIFTIEYTWYGYGAITFGVIKAPNVTTYPNQDFYPMHTIVPSGQTSIEQPNCPISVKIDNGNSAVARSVFVGGRRYAINGHYDPVYRITGERRAGVGTATGAWTPLISFRRKSASKYQAQSVKINDLDILSSGDVYVCLFHNTNLSTGTPPVWGTPTDMDANETVLERDVTADTISGGLMIGGPHVISGSQQRALSQSISILSYDLVESLPVTLCARAVSGTPNITACTFTLKEEW